MHLNTKRTMISIAVAGACAVPALAQQSPAEAPPIEVQQVTVSGFRGSLEKALQLKRESIGTRDSIVAEDIGKFPEQNIADGLIRLPGVEVIKDGSSNEGQRIQLRGLPSEYTVTTFNGAPVRTTSAGNIGGSSRDFNYDVFASELFSRADVYKTPLAELEEGGVAGVVDLQTPRPFDKKGLIKRYSFAGAYNDKTGATSPRAHVLISNTWDNIGFLVSLAHSKAKNGSAGFSSTGVYNSANDKSLAGNNFQFNTAAPTANLGTLTTADLNNAILPRFLRTTTVENVRERTGLNTSLQFKNKTFDLSWDTLYSRLSDDGKTNSLNFPIRDSIVTPTNDRRLVPVNVRIDSNNNLQGTLGNVVLSSNAAGNRSETNFKYNALNGKWTVNERFRLNSQFTVSTSNAWNNGATVSTDGTGVGSRNTITIDTSNPIFPSITTDRNLLDPSLYTAFSYSGGYKTETDKQKTLKLVGDYDYAFGNVEANLKLGVSRVQSTKSATAKVTSNLLNNQVIPGVGLYSAATTAQKTAYGQSQLNQNDLLGISGGVGGNFPSNWMTFDRNFIYETLDAVNQNKMAPINYGGTFEATETIDTLFAQSDFETQLFSRKLRSNLGVRYVRTKSDVDNFILVNGVYQPKQGSGNYTNALPSISFAYDIRKDLTWRTSWGKTLKRSSISNISRAYNVPNAGNLLVDAGNPDLKPEFSKNLDSSIEWYFAKGSVVAVNAFRKNIEGRPISSSLQVPFDQLGLPSALWTGNIQTQVANTPQTPVEVRTFKNAEAFKISGTELAYQQSFKFLPAPFDGLGAILSYTNINTAGVKRTYKGVGYEIPIVPKNTYALTAYYEKGAYSVRTSYNYKTEFANFGQTSTNVVGFQRWANARGYLDASVGYKVNNYVELRLDGSNLTNTQTYDFFRHFEGKFGDENSRVDGAAQNGRVYTLSVRGKF